MSPDHYISVFRIEHKGPPSPFDKKIVRPGIIDHGGTKAKKAILNRGGVHYCKFIRHPFLHVYHSFIKSLQIPFNQVPFPVGA